MAENEELDVIRNKRWRRFTNTLRGAQCLHDDTVLNVFDNCSVPSLRRVCKILKVEKLIFACLDGNQAEKDRLLKEHHDQRKRCEAFADLLVKVIQPGRTYREVVDAFVHEACTRILDQAGIAAVPSDNFPTFDDYRASRAIWMLQMEPRLQAVVDQIAKDPSKLRAQNRIVSSKQQMDEQLKFSLLDRT